MKFPDTPIKLVGVETATLIREGVGKWLELGDSNGPNMNDQRAITSVCSGC